MGGKRHKGAAPGMKKCPKCGSFKFWEEFYKNRKMYDGLASWCIACSKKSKSVESAKARKNRVNAQRIRKGYKGGGFIYFVQIGEKGPIKIGKAFNINTRMKHLQISNPEELFLIKIIENIGPILESDIHFELSEHNIRGEWFHPEPVIDWINNNTV